MFLKTYWKFILQKIFYYESIEAMYLFVFFFCIEKFILVFVLSLFIQGRQDLNSRRGALETPALPLSYGPINDFIYPNNKPDSVCSRICLCPLVADVLHFLRMTRDKLAPGTVYHSSTYHVNWGEVTLQAGYLHVASFPR